MVSIGAALCSGNRPAAAASENDALNEENVICMLITGRFYDSNSGNNGTLSDDYRLCITARVATGKG